MAGKAKYIVFQSDVCDLWDPKRYKRHQKKLLEVGSRKDAEKEVKRLIKETGFKSYYTRIIGWKDDQVQDYGSYSDFYGFSLVGFDRDAAMKALS